MGTKADLIKQSCWAEEEAAEEGKIIIATELSGNHRNRMYCLSQNEISCCSSVEKLANKAIPAKYCWEKRSFEIVDRKFGWKFALEWTSQIVNAANRKQVSVWRLKENV